MYKAIEWTSRASVLKKSASGGEMRISKSPLESVANPANPGSVRICESDLEPSQVPGVRDRWSSRVGTPRRTLSGKARTGRRRARVERQQPPLYAETLQKSPLGRHVSVKRGRNTRESSVLRFLQPAQGEFLGQRGRDGWGDGRTTLPQAAPPWG